MMEMKDLQKKWIKGSMSISPKLYENLKISHPIVASFEACWAERSAILERYYKEMANDKSALRASLKLLGSLPSTSVRIVNTRNSRKILAAQSRLVKTLLNYFVKVPISEDEMTEEDWMSQMKTIHSDPGQEASL